MRIASVTATVLIAAATALTTAVTAYATPLDVQTPDSGPPVVLGSDEPEPALLSCPPLPDADDPLGPIPPRDPLCGEDDMELVPNIYLRSNAYRHLSTIYGPDVEVSLIGNNHYQLRDRRTGELILGEDRRTLHHVPFGREVQPPNPEQLQDLTPHEQALREGLSRVTVGVMQGVVYTGDLTDMSAYLTTPIGSLVVQAPGTGPDPLQPGPGGERRVVPLNNFQVLDNQGRYVMGNTLTLGSPMALWPNAAVPCPLGTVPISQLPPKNSPDWQEQKFQQAADLPDPVCKAPAGVPIAVRDIDDPAPPSDQPGQPRVQQDPVQRQKDINDAYSAVATQFGLAVSVGALLGGISGLAVGCILGAIGGALGGELSAALAGAAGGGVAGCLTGAAILGSIGGTVGSLAIGVPVGIASGVNAYNTLRLQGDVARNPIPDAVQPLVAHQVGMLIAEAGESLRSMAGALAPALPQPEPVAAARPEPAAASQPEPVAPPQLSPWVPPRLTAALPEPVTGLLHSILAPPAPAA
ncbi:hypothetical protein [Nocardia sp. NPDC127526]|uniref:hypothetical protein n=1 Tax=Nocardia sp. NPDC127526 TaxID=3345393 RepID=UPI003630A39D